MKGFLKPKLIVAFVMATVLVSAIVVLIPTGAHAHAATQETLTVPFVNGINGTTTINSYTGFVTISVSGYGQASATQCSDAFYIYTDNSNVQGTCGNPITPYHDGFGLCINNQAVDNYVTAIPPYSSSHTYQFTISVGSSPQQLTFGVCDLYTSDNSGSFTIVVKARWASISSDHQAGYVSTGPTNHPTTYTDVKGAWVVPAAQCSPLETSNSAFWVGLGATSGGTLQQIGTNTGCGGTGNICPLTLPSVPAYCAWYQMFPHKQVHNIILANNGKLAIVKPNDTIQAEITYKKNGNFLFQIRDLTQKWDYSNTDNQPGSQLDSAREDADWITEAPPFFGSILPLTDFTTIRFFNCSADKKDISSAGPRTIQVIMINNGALKATPGVLSPDGTQFRVTWVSSGS